MRTKNEDWRFETGRDFGERARGAAFVRKRWSPTRMQAWDPKTETWSPATWDHDHCEFCWREFSDDESPEVDVEGYTTSGPAGSPERERRDDYHWVCRQCFEDFHERFEWTVAPPASA